MPAIDLYAEYMVLHNSEMVQAAGDDGSKRPGPTLIQACRRYGVVLTMDEAYKEKMRALAYSKSEHTPEEIADLQDYCLNDDCDATMKLFFAMLPYLDLLRAPIRGAFMMEIERIRWRGKPIDMPLIDWRSSVLPRSSRECARSSITSSVPRFTTPACSNGALCCD